MASPPSETANAAAAQADSLPVNAGFGTFTGVFTPTLLTILGVIMYVRLGWVVGNAGLLGTWTLMALAMGITACTGLSLSSIATNTRLGAGGPYAIISRSLGLEVGGSIGVPLYLSRPLGVAMYIFGFREGWLWFFPSHHPIIIDCAVFVALFTLAYVSANLAFKVQYFIMGIIAVSLLSIVFSSAALDPVVDTPTWLGAYRGFPENGFAGTSFWVVFAIFFPATTGILAGANMSGDLKDPRRSIPSGTLWAIAISSLIYFALAWWATRMGTTEELTSNYNLLIDRAFWPPAVLLGLLGATFSSALASAVGGPRIIMAMGQHKILPASDWLSKTSRGEPKNAIALTAILTLGALAMRDLNLIAPLVTMFFLITYFVINLVLLIESSLNLVSFRPTLRIPRFVPLLGAIGCVFVMFVMNPVFGLIAVMVAIAIYIWILKRGVESTVQDVRSGVFSAVAEWAAAKVTELGGNSNARAWKPNLLVPVEDVEELRGNFGFLSDLCSPEGSVKLLGLATKSSMSQLQPDIQMLGDSFRKKDLFCTYSLVAASSFQRGSVIGLQALQSAFFRPNVLFLRLPEQKERLKEYGEITVQAHNTGVGVALLGMHPKAGLGRARAINLWLRPSNQGWDIDPAFACNNLDLILLLGYRLAKRWNAELNLLTVISDPAEQPQAQEFLDQIRELARIPEPSHCTVLVGPFEQAIGQAPLSDLDIMGLQKDPDFEFMQRMITLTRSSCLFVADSGRESARS